MLGIHVSKGKNKSMAAAIRAAVNAFAIDSVQIFTHGPSHSRKNEYGPLPRDVAIYVHGAYLWSGKITDKLIESELVEAEKVGAAGFVIHINDLPPEELTRIVVARVVPIYQRVGCTVPLLFEMPAKKPRKGAPNYATAADLKALTSELAAALPIAWGLCIDTSHVWAGGVVPSVEWFDQLGTDHVKLIHLNANLIKNFGTGKDLHIIPLGKGDAIWGAASSLHRLIRFFAAKKIPLLIEANRGTDAELAECLHQIRRA